MFIELFFAAALDMSMPEFQPQEDISGNVIVSEVDDISGQFIAEEVPLNEIPIEKSSDLPLLGLSQEEDPTENETIIKKNNSLRSGNIITLESEVLANSVISTYNMQIRSSKDKNIHYIYLEANTEYTLNNISTIYFSYGLEFYSTVYTVNYSSTFTPEQNCYLLKQDDSFTVSYSTGDVSGDEPGGDVSGDEPGGDVSGDGPSGNGGSANVDLTNVESKLDNVITLQRSILMTLLVTFLFPIIKSCVNLLKGGKDV